MTNYLRLEEGLRRQDVRSIGRALIVFSLVAAVLLLVLTASDAWDTVAMLLIGSALCALGLRKRESSPFWGKLLVQIGAFPSVLFLGYVFWPLGLLAMVIYATVAVSAFVM